MGYYTRVFCKSGQVPTFNQLRNCMAAKNVTYQLQGGEDENEEWTNLELIYKEGKLPVLVEINRVDNPEDIAKDEVDEFLEAIGSPGLSFKKRKVIRHLKATQYIICCQLPTSDIDDDGFDANSELMDFFVSNYEGMSQADGEGFYDNDDHILVKDS